MHDIDNRMTKIIDQLYDVNSSLKNSDNYMQNEGLSNDFYFSFRNQHATISTWHDQKWTFRNPLDTFYEAGSNLIDKPFKKEMEQFAERLSLVDISL
ncbi:hypothetical protein [Listeria seeligeri]|uniref:hypothetical protein n=1 Tax=Listeria seeligeri TaxID=1640 RepID=UPI0018899DEA|nr:hypothetical protein [Listeria seeligeri]MBF2662488.1 hypothetical protein [Listeria seeligeri]